MGDHFVLLMDRLVTESTLGAAIESRKLSKQSTDLATDDVRIDCSSDDIVFKNSSPLKKMVECRICQDEDEDSNMDTPCSCSGSLKYAHQRCVQKWCNEKGDTICEICRQPFKPGYTAPPSLFQVGRIPMDFRGNWEIHRRDMNNSRILEMVATDRNFLERDMQELEASTRRSWAGCRSVALIFMFLLFMRHVLPIIIGEQDFSPPIFSIILVQILGAIVPIYFLVRTVNAIWQCRRQQVPCI